MCGCVCGCGVNFAATHVSRPLCVISVSALALAFAPTIPRIDLSQNFFRLAPGRRTNTEEVGVGGGMRSHSLPPSVSHHVKIELMLPPEHGGVGGITQSYAGKTSAPKFLYICGVENPPKREHYILVLTTSHTQVTLILWDTNYSQTTHHFSNPPPTPPFYPLSIEITTDKLSNITLAPPPPSAGLDPHLNRSWWMVE